jgi:DUF971 family protein
MTPEEITLHQRSGILELRYENGTRHELTAEYLRVFSPSAEVQGHSEDQAVLQHGKKNVKISAVERQGNYAIKLTFSDGHDSGIYSWRYLFDLGTNYEHNWADYLKRLEDAGKSREPQFIAVGR